MMLGGSANATPEVRAYALDQIAKLGESLKTRKDTNPLTEAHYRQAERDIARYLENPTANAPKSAMPPWGGRPQLTLPASSWPSRLAEGGDSGEPGAWGLGLGAWGLGLGLEGLGLGAWGLGLGAWGLRLKGWGASWPVGT